MYLTKKYYLFYLKNLQNYKSNKFYFDTIHLKNIPDSEEHFIHINKLSLLLPNFTYSL